MVKKLKNEKLLIDIMVLILFLIITLIITIPLYRTGRISIRSDGSFHLSRVEEIYENLKSGSFFTFIATHTFHSTGTGNFLFYPAVFLYPMAVLRFVFSPITSFYVWYGMFMFLTMGISYYSMNVFSADRLRGFIFSLLYTFGGYHLYLGAGNFVLGEFIAYTFIPLLIVGMYCILWGRNDKWYLLSIGFSLIAYSHILSVIMSTIILIVVLLFKLFTNDFKVNKKIIFLIVKAGFLSIGLMGWIIVPFVTDYMCGNISSPHPNILFTNTLSQAVMRSLDSSIYIQQIGFILVSVALIGWIFVKKSSKEAAIYIIGMVIFIGTTTIIPWSLLKNTSLSIIQFPYRLLTYASLFLAVTGSFIISNIKLFKAKNIAFFSTIIVIIAYFGTISPVLERNSNQNGQYLNIASSINPIERVPYDTQLDYKNYNGLFKYSVMYGETDYFSNKSFKTENISNDRLAHTITMNKAKINSKEKIVYPYVKPNELVYSLKEQSDKRIDLPVIAYNNTVVKNNGRNTNFTVSSRGTVEVKSLSGVNKIQVSYRPKLIFYIAFYISILTWIVLMCLGLFNLLNKKVKNETISNSSLL